MRCSRMSWYDEPEAIVSSEGLRECDCDMMN